MKFNNTTIILIVVLLLIVYLFDNIKELEDKLLSNPRIEHISITENYKPRNQYFKEFKVVLPDEKEEEIPKHVNILPATLPLHAGAQSGIKPEHEVKVHSQDKFITGASAPGNTTMSLNIIDSIEKPLFLNMKHYNV
jgi:hypothetical protein